jgi:hypothetical protein
VKKLVKATIDFFNAKPIILLAIILGIHLLSHLPYMQLPAVGNHVWRQCNTLAVARNYYEEDMNILKPRIDKRYNTPGITGPQFTAYDWTLACIYKVFGYSESAHRWFSWAISALAIIAMYFLVLTYTANRFYASFCAFFMAFVPEFYYHSINALPDILALAAMLWAWYFGRLWLKSFSWIHCFVTAVLFALAGMVKMQFLVAATAVGIELILLKPVKYKIWLQAATMAAIALFATGWWYLFAAKLVKLYGLHEFVHAIRFAGSIQQFFKIIASTLFSDLPEIFLGYGFIVFFVFGLHFLKTAWHRYAGLVAYAFACLAFYFLMQFQFIHHGYYVIIFLPALAFISAKGADFMLQSRWPALILILWLAPIWAWQRTTLPNQTQGHYKIPDSFLSASARNEFRKLSDTGLRWIVGPDVSGCVYFYYLHAKGFPWLERNQKYKDFEAYHKQGATGVITNDTAALFQLPEMRAKLQPAGRAVDFYWYRFRE